VKPTSKSIVCKKQGAFRNESRCREVVIDVVRESVRLELGVGEEIR
jgi:hypothetical protein